jgi:HEAT repeat protein
VAVLALTRWRRRLTLRIIDTGDGVPRELLPADDPYRARSGTGGVGAHRQGGWVVSGKTPVDRHSESLVAGQVSELVPSHSGRDLYAVARAESVVKKLENLHDGPLVFHEVVRLGEAAIPALEKLVRGPSHSIYHSRCLAVDALAAIATPEAVRALTRSLRDSIARELDPASLEAESVLVNHIAEHLTRFSDLDPDLDVNDALLAALQRRRYPYCAAALGLIGDPRAVPLLIECLFEDCARAAAGGALRRFGRSALTPLLSALREPRVVAGIEPPTHVEARAAAARLIGECVGLDVLLDAVALAALSKALDDPQRCVRVEAALALVRRKAPGAAAAARMLVMALDDPDWARAQTLAAALVRLGPAAERLIVAVLGVRPRTDADHRRRLRAVDVAGQLGTERAVACLRALSASSDAQLRLAVISSLSRSPALDVDWLTHFLTDREPMVRRRALQALHRRRVLPTDSATQLLGDGDSDVRRLASASVCENLDAALPALQRAAYGFGAPLHGWRPRWRLWWHACALIAVGPRSRGVLAAGKRLAH